MKNEDIRKISAIWALRKAVARHIDHEHQVIFPRALALTSSES